MLTFFVFALTFVSLAFGQCPNSTCEIWNGPRPLFYQDITDPYNNTACHSQWPPQFFVDLPSTKVYIPWYSGGTQKQYHLQAVDYSQGRSDPFDTQHVRKPYFIPEAQNVTWSTGTVIGRKFYGLKLETPRVGSTQDSYSLWEYNMATETLRQILWDGTDHERSVVWNLYRDADGDGQLYYVDRASTWAFRWRKLDTATGMTTGLGDDSCYTSQYPYAADVYIKSSMKRVWASTYHSSEKDEMWICDYTNAAATVKIRLPWQVYAQFGGDPDGFFDYNGYLYFWALVTPYLHRMPIGDNDFTNLEVVTLPGAQFPFVNGFQPWWTEAETEIIRIFPGNSHTSQSTNRRGDKILVRLQYRYPGFTRVKLVGAIWHLSTNKVQPLMYRTGHSSSCRRNSQTNLNDEFSWQPLYWADENEFFWSWPNHKSSTAYWSVGCDISGYQCREAPVWRYNPTDTRALNFYEEPIPDPCCDHYSQCNDLKGPMDTCLTANCVCGGFPALDSLPKSQGQCNIYRHSSRLDCCQDDTDYCTSAEFYDNMPDLSPCQVFTCNTAYNPDKCIASNTARADYGSYDCCQTDADCPTDDMCHDWSCVTTSGASNRYQCVAEELCTQAPTPPPTPAPTTPAPTTPAPTTPAPTTPAPTTPAPTDVGATNAPTTAETSAPSSSGGQRSTTAGTTPDAGKTTAFDQIDGQPMVGSNPLVGLFGEDFWWWPIAAAAVCCTCLALLLLAFARRRKGRRGHHATTMAPIGGGGAGASGRSRSGSRGTRSRSGSRSGRSRSGSRGRASSRSGGGGGGGSGGMSSALGM